MNKLNLRRAPFHNALKARVLAKLIDVFIAFLISFFLFPVGILIAAAYIAGADSLQDGRSVGKKFMGLRVVDVEDGQPCTIKQSIIRNLPFVLPLLVGLFPIVGPVLGFLMGAAFSLLELYLVATLRSAARIGDVLADTTVCSPSQNELHIKERVTSWFNVEDGQAT